jgi:hypothetical protein
MSEENMLVEKVLGDLRKEDKELHDKLMEIVSEEDTLKKLRSECLELHDAIQDWLCFGKDYGDSDFWQLIEEIVDVLVLSKRMIL